MKKTTRRTLSLFVTGALLLSSFAVCGKKDDKVVVDYGGRDSAPSSSENGTPGDSTGIGDTLTSSKTLVEQLGDYAKWTEPFTAQDITFETNKLYKVPDAEYVNSYAVQVPSLSSEDEQAFADRFFEILKSRCDRKSVTDYVLWKEDLPELTIDLLSEYQAEITANMLIMGALKYDRPPSEDEMQKVDLEKLQKKTGDEQ